MKSERMPIGLLVLSIAIGFNVGTYKTIAQGAAPSKEQIAALLVKAKAGDVESQWLVGSAYEDGHDYVNAAFWLRKAAASGNVLAQDHLAYLYDQGNGVPQDDAQTAFWLRKAAERGDAYAQYNLGLLYSEGQGVPQDDKLAAFWWRKAAAQGNEKARRSLAETTAASQSNRHVSSKELTVAELVRHSNGAVVQIVVSDETGKEISLGSGFIVSPDGMIVTNFHVIQNAHSVVAKMADGSFIPVEGVAAVDADKDLAVLKVNGKGLPSLKLKPATSLQVGDHVVAIGSPLGFEGTVSDGIVSALRTETPGQNWIQTTAPVSHGNSGGPLLDMNGDVIGVITWGVDQQQGENLNFAIPTEEVITLVSSAHNPIPFDAAARNIENTATNSTSENNTGTGNEKADALVAEGHKSVAAKEYERAIHDFEGAIRINKENAAAWNGLGIAHSLLNQIEESVADFSQAVKYAPNDEGYWVSLGIGYRALNKPSEAQSALQEAVEISPTDATAWLYLGMTYDALHNRDQAVRCYGRATSIAPDNAEAWYELGQTSGSIAALNKAVEIKPDYAKAWAALALAFDRAKQYEQAVGAWKKLLALKSDDTFLTDARVWWFVGSDYSNLNDLKDAEQAYLEALHMEQALQYHTNDDNNLIGNIFEALYLTYSKMGKHRESEEYRENFVWWEQNKPK
jgi:S1-C subfamily serine protease